MSKNNIFLFFIKVSFMWTPKEPIKKKLETNDISNIWTKT